MAQLNTDELKTFEVKCARCRIKHQHQQYGSGQPPPGFVTLSWTCHFLTTTTSPGHKEPVLCPACFTALEDWLKVPPTQTVEYQPETYPPRGYQ